MSGTLPLRFVPCPTLTRSSTKHWAHQYKEEPRCFHGHRRRIRAWTSHVQLCNLKDWRQTRHHQQLIRESIVVLMCRSYYTVCTMVMYVSSTDVWTSTESLTSPTSLNSLSRAKESWAIDHTLIRKKLF